MNYSLDAGPIIAYLDNEPGADKVEAILTEAGSVCYAHVINLSEVYYIYYWRGGVTTAEKAMKAMLDVGVIFRDDGDTAFWKEAASFKGRYPMALPDGFCLTLARRLAGTAVTTDHAEFDALVPLGYCPIFFIR